MDKKIEIAGKRLTINEILVYLGTLVLIITSFMAFVGSGNYGEYYVEDYSFIRNGGILAIILALIACACIFLKFESISLPVCGVLDVYTLYKLIFGILERDEFRHIRMGGWLTFGACILITIGCYLCYKEAMQKKNIK